MDKKTFDRLCNKMKDKTKFDIFFYDKDNDKDVLYWYQIPDKAMYMFCVDVGDESIAVNPITAVDKIKVANLFLANEEYVVELVNGKSYTKSVEDTLHGVDSAPEWSKKVVTFYSYSYAKIKSIRKDIKYFAKHKVTSPYDCLTFEV